MIIIPLFRPLLFCLKKVTTSSLCQNIQEGRTFQQRLKVVIESKLCKLKFTLPNTENESETELNQFITNTIISTIDYCNKLLNSPDAMLRQISYQCYLCIVRSIIVGNNMQLKTFFNTHYNEILVNYFKHKNHKLNNKIINEIITRYTDYILPIIFETIINAMLTSKTEYLQNETFRLINFILINKFSSLNDNNKIFVLNFTPKVLQNVIQILTNNPNLVKYKAKRIKSLLSFIKNLFSFLKNNIKLNTNETNYNLVYVLNGNNNNNKTNQSNNISGSEIKTEIILIDNEIILSLKHYFETNFSENFSFIVNNISIKRIYEQITNLLNAIPTIAIPTKTSSKSKKTKKHHDNESVGNTNNNSTSEIVSTIPITSTTSTITVSEIPTNKDIEKSKHSKKRSQESEESSGVPKGKKHKKKKHEERDFEMELVTEMLNEKKKQTKKE